MMLADQLNYLPNDILVKVDRAAMYNSLKQSTTTWPYSGRVCLVYSNWVESDKNGGKRILRDILSMYVLKVNW